jgi:hypothetical protein
MIGDITAEYTLGGVSAANVVRDTTGHMIHWLMKRFGRNDE